MAAANTKTAIVDGIIVSLELFRKNQRVMKENPATQGTIPSGARVFPTAIKCRSSRSRKSQLV